MERHFCTPDCFGLFARTASCFGAFGETAPSFYLRTFCSGRLMCGSTRFVILPFVVLYRIRFFNFSCIFRNCRAIANRHIGTCATRFAEEMSFWPKILIRHIGTCACAVRQHLHFAIVTFSKVFNWQSILFLCQAVPNPPRASKSLLFLKIYINNRYFFYPPPSLIRPEPRNRYFSYRF